MNLKSIAKSLVPPIIISAIKWSLREKNKDDLTWKGNYKQWSEAKKVCTGYDNQNILEACRRALHKVKTGQAVYERDSVLFNEKEYSWPLLASLQHIALKYNGILSILDFGGSLGSSYYQNKDFLGSLKKLNWTVVEQANFVECGKAEFENEELNFEYTIDEAKSKKKYNCLLLSNVVQYLDDPYSWIRKFIDFNFDFIIIDFLTCADKQQLTVQNVPSWIYKASYPCYFFDDKELLSEFSLKYELISTHYPYTGFRFDLEGNNRGVFKGFFFKTISLI